jgi:hypothetical protein
MTEQRAFAQVANSGAPTGGGNGGNDNPIEKISFCFQKIENCDFPRPGPINKGFDIEKLKFD